MYLEYFFHIKLDLRLVIVDRNKLHFTSAYLVTLYFVPHIGVFDYWDCRNYKIGFILILVFVSV